MKIHAQKILENAIEDGDDTEKKSSFPYKICIEPCIIENVT